MANKIKQGWKMSILPTGEIQSADHMVSLDHRWIQRISDSWVSSIQPDSIHDSDDQNQ